MKKVISVLLTLVMLLSFAVPAAAISFEQPKSQIPVIRISGDGNEIYDKDGNMIFHFSEMGKLFEGVGGDSLKESVLNVLQPFLIEGVLTGNYDNYYKALEKEVGEIFEKVRLDKNGEVTDGSDISGWHRWKMWESTVVDRKGDKGYYDIEDYWFWYDWRKDPLAVADEFNDYVKAIKNVTGSDKVSILASCLGTNVVMAYIAKYGTDDIYGVGFDGGVMNGAEVLSDPISGKFRVNGNAISRFLSDCEAFGTLDLDPFINDTLDLLTKSGVLDTAVGVVKEQLYYKLFEGVTSALALSTFYTWPSYWSAVTAEDYETAKTYVFGKEGSEKRAEYAGLIEKLDNYDAQVRQKLPELYQKLQDDGVLVGVISKYGCQLSPICESADMLADQIVSVERSSFGATTSLIYSTLSDDYIAEQTQKGLEKYISPDKQVDASTCLWRDSTWFVKGATHSNWTYPERLILYTVITADRQLTVDDLPYTQFMVYDNDTEEMSPMTTENCNTYHWTDTEQDIKPANKAQWLSALIRSFMNWLTSLIKLLTGKFVTVA